MTTVEGARIPVKLHVDLGDAGSLSLIPGSIPEIRVPDGAPVAQGAGLSGTVERRMGRVAALEFGSHRLNDVTCSFTVAGYATTAERQGVLGLEVLSRFRLILDYPRKRMILEETSLTHEPFQGDLSGASFWPHAQSFVIQRVRPDSPAAEIGLREGDLLVELNGIPATDLRFREVNDLLRHGHGERVSLVLRRDEEVMEVELVLRRLY